jgi:hypothetical protein
VGVLLVSCVIKRVGDFLHGTPRALSISRKNGVVPEGNDAISHWEAMTKSRCGFADPLIRVYWSHDERPGINGQADLGWGCIQKLQITQYVSVVYLPTIYPPA